MNDLREFCVKEAATARKELERLGDKFPTSTNYAFDRGLNLGLSHAFDRGLNLGFAQAMEMVIKKLEAGDKATVIMEKIINNSEMVIDAEGDYYKVKKALIREILGEANQKETGGGRPGHPKEYKDPVVTCWHCGSTHTCDCMDATCYKCGAPYAKERCKEFNFTPKEDTCQECGGSGYDNANTIDINDRIPCSYCNGKGRTPKEDKK